MDVIGLDLELAYVEPRVKRSLTVPLTLRLDRLHLVIQAAMGWQNSHLYTFETKEQTWAHPSFAEDGMGEYSPADKASLSDLMAKGGAKLFVYRYDMGDDWEHVIKLGKPAPAQQDQLYPRLSKIEGRCPPEDVGGPPGYDYFLQALADPKHPEHEELKQWHGSDFDPQMPNKDALSFEVLKLAQKWKPKAKKS